MLLVYNALTLGTQGTQLGEETGKWLLRKLRVATVESLASRVKALERKVGT